MGHLNETKLTYVRNWGEGVYSKEAY